jgi:hypothetical protein
MAAAECLGQSPKGANGVPSFSELPEGDELQMTYTRTGCFDCYTRYELRFRRSKDPTLSIVEVIRKWPWELSGQGKADPAHIEREARFGRVIVKRVDLLDADLQYAVGLLRQMTGVQILIQPTDRPYGRVTLSIENRTLDQILRNVCRSAGASLSVQDDRYVIAPKDLAFEKPIAPPRNLESGKQQPKVEMRIENLRPQFIRKVLGELSLTKSEVNGLDKLFEFYRSPPKGRTTTRDVIAVLHIHSGKTVASEEFTDESCSAHKLSGLTTIPALVGRLLYRQ